MNLRNALRRLADADHSDSFRKLEPWLRNNRPRRGFSSVFKMVASFLTLALVIVACSLPVSHEVEVGHIIRGTVADRPGDYKTRLRTQGLEAGSVEVSVLHTKDHENDAPNRVRTLVAMYLPQADRPTAEEHKKKLQQVFDFQSVEIIPVKDTVEQPLIQVAIAKTLNVSITRPKGQLTKSTLDSLSRVHSFRPEDIESIEMLHKDDSVQLNMRVRKGDAGNEQ